MFKAGIRVMSVTDHDTRAGEGPARTAALACGVELISGIEITTVHDGKDVHVLGYGLPADAPEVELVIARQREERVARAREIAERLEHLGAPIDVESLLSSAAAPSGRTIARPQIARCLVAAGHVTSVAEAFERYLDEHRPAYVPHRGASPSEVITLVENCGGVTSLAHPGRLKGDDLIVGLVDAGLRCIEAYHSSHDVGMQNRYLDLAVRYGLAVSGGSDFHGEGTNHAELFGAIGLPLREIEQFRRLLADARARAGTPAANPAR